MTQEHTIRPPHELVQQWVSLACENEGYETWQDLATQAARWGADQELEACCEWLVNEGHEYEHVALRDARRPKPPSLKEQALQALNRFMATEGHEGCTDEEVEEDYYLIRQAVESLPS